MKTKMFIGKDEHDLETQIWAWTSFNPGIAIKKWRPIEKLDLAGDTHPSLANPDAVSVKIDYEEEGA
jgi:hypothetical protein